jgi:branched-chain amino acid transport system permease protein
VILLQALVSGLLLGAVYALVAIGLGLVWGVMKILNIAHAALAILGAYLALSLMQAVGMDPVLSLVVSVPVLFLIGAGLQHFLIGRLEGRKDFETHSFLVLYGVMVIVENLSVYLWSADVRVIAPAYASHTLLLEGVALPLGRVVSFAVAVASLMVVYFFLSRSQLGLAVRAIAFDREAAGLVGISVNRTSMIAFGLGTATAAVAGLAIGLVSSFFPGIQIVWVSKAFLVVVLGGVDNIPGLVLAATLLGIVETVVGLTAPLYMVDFVAYVLLIAILMIRPQGLLGRRV